MEKYKITKDDIIACLPGKGRIKISDQQFQEIKKYLEN